MEETGADLEQFAKEENVGAQAEQACIEIEGRMADPTQKIAATGESAGFLKAIREAAQPHLKTIFIDTQWKDVKAIVAGAFSLIPFLGTVKNVASAAEKGKIAVTIGRKAGPFASFKDVAPTIPAVTAGTKEAAARLAFDATEKAVGIGAARLNFWNALKAIPKSPPEFHAVDAVGDAWKAGKNARKARNAVREAETGLSYASISMSDNTYKNLVDKATSTKAAIKPAVRAAGKAVGLEAVKHIVRSLDPYPDVPRAVTTVTSIAEFVLPGASLISSLWQLGRDSWERSKAQINLGKDVGKVVADHVRKKFRAAKSPEVRQAAAAFMPAAV